jgi:nicotinate phosphoribosyltransferase
MRGLYGQSLALLTDLYELTMAYGYWKLGMADREACFHLSFRSNPFHTGFSLACGLHDAVDYLTSLRFDGSDIEYLASLKGNDGGPLFEDRAFFEYLRAFRFTCDVDAIREGTPVFPYEPLLRVTGPMLQAQLVETPMLTIINFQTLIATKASRVCFAAQGEPVLDFGLRRSQGIDGGLTASRAAYVGGAAATANVLAGKLFDIPVRGTHAHSWVMAFDDELEAFEQYARVMPNNCVFLVDTYNTLDGVRRAARVGRELQKTGHKLVGIRLDSGDLAYLSIEARKILDAAGLRDAAILASNELDEHLIASLKQQGATITVWGVGTKLVTGGDQPALGGVYKLSALKDAAGRWAPRIKRSEQAAKSSVPGIQQVRRYRDESGRFTGDAIYEVGADVSGDVTIVSPTDMTRRKTFDRATPHEDLLVPILRRGQLVYDMPGLHDVRHRASEQMDKLHPTIRRLDNPHAYPAGLEEGLLELRTRMLLERREPVERREPGAKGDS